MDACNWIESKITVEMTVDITVEVTVVAVYDTMIHPKGMFGYPLKIVGGVGHPHRHPGGAYAP